MRISIKELLENLENAYPEGLQVSCRMGLLSVTKAIYLKNSKVYLFAMEDNFSFKKENGFSKEEFLREYSTYYWLIEDFIN